MLQNRCHHLLPPSGVAPARELVSATYPVCPLVGLREREIRAVSKRGVHDDGQPTCEGTPRFALVRPLGDGQRPVFQRERASIAGQHDVGGLVKQCSDPPVTALGDAARVVDLTGLIATWHQAKVGANRRWLQHDIS